MFSNRGTNLARVVSRLKQQSGSLVGRPTAAPMVHAGSLGSSRSYAYSPPIQFTMSDHSQAGFHSVSLSSQASVSLDANDMGHHQNGKDEKASSSTDSSPNPTKNPLPDFDDSKAAYAAKTNFELYRSALTYTVCQLSFLVKHAETLLSFSRKTLGDGITDALLKVSLFGHFCAGEDLKGIRPAIQTLEKHGIGSILDFAAEDDGESQKQPKPNTIEEELSSDTLPHPETEARRRLKVRVYDYTSEAQCDQHLEHFRRCIQDVAALGPDGYAAVKVSFMIFFSVSVISHGIQSSN